MQIGVNKEFISIINQIFEIEKKVNRLKDLKIIETNLERIKSYLNNLSLSYQNPIGEQFSITRTDCEAAVIDNSKDVSTIIDVLKPIIRYTQDDVSIIVQKGIVITD